MKFINRFIALYYFIKRLNYNTIRFNFTYFSLKTALRFPVIISNNVLLKKLEGSIILDFPIRTGIIEIGYGDVAIFDKLLSRGILEIDGKIVFRGKTNIGHGSKISVSNAILDFGDNFIITAESTIICKDDNITFGKNCLLSWDILIMNSDFHNIYDSNSALINAAKAIIVSDNVWIGCRCIILKGAVVPTGSIIGSGTLIGRDLKEENCIYAGNPVKMLKSDISWK